ncbi:MAG: cation:proton antiporter [Thaumarchaeota archaeon]|nr:cation:proton antiporter [Nitrososphaerota archaeon]
MNIIEHILGNFTLSDKVQHILHSNFLKNDTINLNHYISQSFFHNSNLESVQIVFLSVGVIIVLGIMGDAFFRKTGVPDVIFLMITGVIIGPVLGIVDAGTIFKIAPYFTALATIMILFGGGLTLNIKNVIYSAHFAFLIAFLGFALSAAVTAIIAVYGLGWNWLDAILLGIMIGGSSEAIVFGLIKTLRVSDKTKAILALESTITSIMSFIGAFFLFDQIQSNHFIFSSLGITVTKSVLTGLGLGIGVGIPWMYVTSKITDTKYSYLLTLGILFMLFFFANLLGESGALTALIFGLMYGNRQFISRRLKIKMDGISTDNSFYEHLAFLVRTFFFVFVGLLANFGQIGYIVFGVAIGIALYVSRISVVKVSLTKNFLPFDRKIISFMLPRGLAPAVLATIPLTLGLPHAAAYPQIVFVVIIASVIISTIAIKKAHNELLQE